MSHLAETKYLQNVLHKKNIFLQQLYRLSVRASLTKTEPNMSDHLILAVVLISFPFKQNVAQLGNNILKNVLITVDLFHQIIVNFNTNTNVIL